MPSPNEPLSLSALLKKYNLRPRKGLGQNFLADPIHLEKIVEAAQLTADDTVLEIGPGPGTLTRLLAEAAGRVIAVELDPNMVKLLQNEYTHLDNLTIIQADILQTQIDTLLTAPSQITTQLPQSEIRNPKSEIENPQSEIRNPKSEIENPQSEIRNPKSAMESPKSEIRNPKSYKVVANLPYYITSAVLRHLLEADPRPERIVVTVQKEVGRRMVAGPGQMSLLAVSVQFYGRPAIVHRIPAGAFYPPPKVDSVVVRIDTFPQPPIEGIEADHFFAVVKAGFGQKRKQLKNALTAGLPQPSPVIVKALREAGIDPTRRAQSLSLAEWGRLAGAVGG